MKFSYRSVIASDPESDDFLVMRRPDIPLSIAGLQGRATVIGLVDTGSDYTIFPKQIAEYLGIALRESRSLHAVAFGGQHVPLYEGEAALSVGDGAEKITWRTVVCFFDFPDAAGEAILLGHQSFLDYFVATFDGENGELTLTPTSELLEFALRSGE